MLRWQSVWNLISSVCLIQCNMRSEWLLFASCLINAFWIRSVRSIESWRSLRSLSNLSAFDFWIDCMFRKVSLSAQASSRRLCLYLSALFEGIFENRQRPMREQKKCTTIFYSIIPVQLSPLVDHLLNSPNAANLGSQRPAHNTYSWNTE